MRPSILNSWNIRFYSDVPADPVQGSYSHPGTLLANFSVTPDHYLTPIQGPVATAGGHDVYQYSVDLSYLGDRRFFQQGTAADPITYWLSIQAVYDHPAIAAWGWQETVFDKDWNDKATTTVFYNTGQEKPRRLEQGLHQPRHVLRTGAGPGAGHDGASDDGTSRSGRAPAQAPRVNSAQTPAVEICFTRGPGSIPGPFPLV